MPDPLSVCEEDWHLEEVSTWKLISTLLSRNWSLPHPNTAEKIASQVSPSLSPGEGLVCWKNLEDILTTLQLGLSACDTLRTVLTSDAGHFFRIAFSSMISLARRMPELFPSGEIPILHPGVDSKVSFTREQIACLLVHMFLCSIQPAKWNKFWVNFHIWYSSDSKPSSGLPEITPNLLQSNRLGRCSSFPSRVSHFSKVCASLPPKLDRLQHTTTAGDTV